jgi:hypothetical protein
MALQTLTIGKQQFILIAKREFQKLAQQAQRQTEDDYWTQAALVAEAKAKSRKEKPIPFDVVEKELEARKGLRSAHGRKKR